MIIYSKEIAAKIHEDFDPALFGTEIYYYTDASTGSYKLQLKNMDGTVLSEVDCTDFIKDGMVESVEVDGSDLVITFNTDAGKQTITLDLSQVFDASNYYTKVETDGRIGGAIANLGLGDASTHNVDTSIGSPQIHSSNLPTSEAVFNFVEAEGRAVMDLIGEGRITITNGYPSSPVDSFNLNQKTNQTINLGLNAAAYCAVADMIPGNDTNALPTVSAVTTYIAGLNYATVSQLPTVSNATISIKRNASDANPALFTLNQANNEALNLNLGDAAESGVDSSIGSASSSNLPTSDAVKAYINGQGYAQIANIGAAAYVGVDTSIPASGTSSNLPTSDAVKAYAYSKAEVDDYIANVVYDVDTKTLTFTRGDGSSFTVTLT
jgi:hypothetical protein